MKLPRWLVIAMLSSSVLAVLTAAGWWWVRWPERTARELVELLIARDDDHAFMMMGIDSAEVDSVRNFRLFSDRPVAWSEVVPQPRSWGDFLQARHAFRLGRDARWGFTAERGAIPKNGFFAGLRDPQGVVHIYPVPFDIMINKSQQTTPRMVHPTGIGR